MMEGIWFEKIARCEIPGLFFLGVLAFCLSIAIFFHGRHKIGTWRLGAMGEKVVGQILDREMSSRGYRVYHDIQISKGCRKMNIDHLIVGENGVFLLEDKTWSKPVKGQTVVRFDGRRVFRNEVPDERPVREAFALAKEANAYIRKLSGLSVPVKPVLVFVGWYNQAENREEIRAGEKQSHWIWFVFPQLKGLGFSETSEYYGIDGLDEAKAYLADPVLGARLKEISAALLAHEGKSVSEIFGYPDDLKVCSSMTLFDAVEPNAVFADVLAAFYDGKRDELTLEMLKGKC